MRHLSLVVLLGLPLSMLACGDKGGDDTGTPTDGGSTDGGSTDGGSTDGGSTDGGGTDGGGTDGGSPDGGSGDGGMGDGGSGDGGMGDGGSGDGGSGDGGMGDGGMGDGGGFGDGGTGDGGGFGDGGMGDGGGFGDGGMGDGGGFGDGGMGDGGAPDGGSADGGSADGGAGDGGATVSLTPTGMYLIWEDSIVDQTHDTVTSSGVDLGSFWGILLSNDDFGFDYTLTDDYCLFKYDTGGAAASTECPSCWDGMAWELTTDDKPDTQGNCEGLDPDAWGKDPATGFEGIDVIYGYGPDEAGYVDDLLVKYGWEDSGWDDTMLWGTYVWSDALGLTDGIIDSNQWGVGYAFAVDSSYELTGDVATMSGTTPPDGYYATIGFYYFPIE